MRDQDVLRVVSDGLSGLDMDTPAEDIIAGGNSRRRLAAVTVAGVAVAAGAGRGPTSSQRLGISWTIGHGPAGHLGSGEPGRLLRGCQCQRHGDAQAVTHAARRPDAVRDALSRAGVPADVRIGTACYSVPAPPGLDRVFSSDGEGAGTVLVITPSAIAKGAVATIGYRDPSSNGPVAFGLAWRDRMTC